jgi:uncharacterized protein
MRRLLLVAALPAALLASGPAAAAQTDGPACPEYRGVVCDGWVTDTAGVVENDARLEETVARVVADRGHEIAVVVVPTTGSLDPRSFAEELGNTWGVGSAERDDGIVILVAIEERRTEIVTGSGLSIDGLDDVAAAGNSAFGAGDFDGGIIAILGSLDRR